MSPSYLLLQVEEACRRGSCQEGWTEKKMSGMTFYGGRVLPQVSNLSHFQAVGGSAREVNCPWFSWPPAGAVTENIAIRAELCTHCECSEIQWGRALHVKCKLLTSLRCIVRSDNGNPCDRIFAGCVLTMTCQRATTLAVCLTSNIIGWTSCQVLLLPLTLTEMMMS